MNVVLISRTLSKLETVADEISDKYGVKTIVVAVDFADFDEKAQTRVTRAVEGLDIGVLINNVGMSYPHPHFFTELSEDVSEDLIELNVHSTTRMTRLILPLMEKNKRGAIVNMGSGSGEFPAPLLTQYSATKAYVDLFSSGLDSEYRPKGIHVQSQTPFFVTTKLAKIRHASLTVPSAAQYAKSAVRHIGYESVTSPYWVHALMLYVIDVLPASLVNHYVRGMHLALRKRALKKAAKAK